MRTQLIALSVLALAASVSAHAETKLPYEPGTYEIDTAHSKVGFEISHMVISSVEGRFNSFKGDVKLEKSFPASSANMEVEINSIDTGNAKRDGHLKSPDFFDAAKYPKMVFKTTKVEGDADHLTITGNLTLHGQTHPVTFEGKYRGTVNDPSGDKKVAFEATSKNFKRSEFGLKWNKMIEAGPMVGDDVTITLKIEAAKAEKAPAKKSR